MELGLIGRTTGIFWDYENVPLRHTDWEAFLEGITHFVERNTIAFTRIYGRESTMSDQDYELITNLKIFDFEWVQHNDPNAADYSLIDSCVNVLKLNQQINQVLLISGDGDFLELTDQLNEWQVAIILICQQKNYNKNLVSDVHSAYTVNFVAQNPFDWWLHR